MSEIYGKNIICDRCNNTHFLERLSKNDTNPIYEDVPIGWTSVNLFPFNTDVKTLCPHCTDVLKVTINRFMDMVKLSEESDND